MAWVLTTTKSTTRHAFQVTRPLLYPHIRALAHASWHPKFNNSIARVQHCTDSVISPSLTTLCLHSAPYCEKSSIITKCFDRSLAYILTSFMHCFFHCLAPSKPH